MARGRPGHGHIALARWLTKARPAEACPRLTAFARIRFVSDLEAARDDLYAVLPEGWKVGRLSLHDEADRWKQYAYDPASSRTWASDHGSVAVAPTEVKCVRETGYCLRELREVAGRVRSQHRGHSGSHWHTREPRRSACSREPKQRPPARWRRESRSAHCVTANGCDDAVPTDGRTRSCPVTRTCRSRPATWCRGSMLSIGDEEFDAAPGSSWCIGSGVYHGAMIVEDSIAIEVFSPVREDLLPVATQP